MRPNLSLTTTQAFWQTPRNIAVLVAAVAAVSGARAFELGQSQPPQTIIIRQPAPATR